MTCVMDWDTSGKFPTPENLIPDVFNEVDNVDESESILRTIINFSIKRSDGKLIAIDELGGTLSYVGKVVVTGDVLEPLKPEWRQEILNIVCTSRQDAPTSVDQFAIVVPNQQRRKKKVDNANAGKDEEGCDCKIDLDTVKVFDRAALKTGDVIDGYCVKTFKWYEANIVNAVKDGKGDRLRIHFKGWNAKYDEWVDRDSERLAPKGTKSKHFFLTHMTAILLIILRLHRSIKFYDVPSCKKSIGNGSMV